MWRTTEGYQVALVGRPHRETVVSHDEIVSLRIDLETMDAEHFVAKYCDPDPSVDLPRRISFRRSN